MENSVKLFSGLIEKYDKNLIKFAQSFVKSSTIAEELVSDVFYKLWKRKEQIDHIKNIESYLYTATKNHCLDYIKSKSWKNDINTETATNLDFMIDNFSPEEALIHKELLVLIEDVVQGLPHSCRVVFQMVRGKGLKQDEVAKLLGISRKTVENQVAKAVKKLRIAIKNYLDEQQEDNSNYKVLMIILGAYLKYLPEYIGDVS